MTTSTAPEPAPFTSDDFAARMSRVAGSAAEQGLAGVLVTPGPDLLWLTGYRPTAIRERLTMLVLSADNEPTLLVPILERLDAEAVLDPDTIRALAVAREPAETIAHAAVHEGMMRLREDGLEKVRRGLTSISEIARVAGTR